MPKRQRTGAYKKSGVTINLGAAAPKGKRKYKRSYRPSYGTFRVPIGTHTANAGTSWRNATDEQKIWRTQNKFYGRGAYGLKDIWKGARGLLKQHGGKGGADGQLAEHHAEQGPGHFDPHGQIIEAAS